MSTETLAFATIAAVGGATASVFFMDNWLKKLRAGNKSHFDVEHTDAFGLCRSSKAFSNFDNEG